MYCTDQGEPEEEQSLRQPLEQRPSMIMRVSAFAVCECGRGGCFLVV